MTDSFLYYELKVSSLPGFTEDETDDLVGYYLDFRNPDDLTQELDAVEIVPARYNDAGDIESDRASMRRLKSICEGVYERRGTTDTRIADVDAHTHLFRRLEGYYDAGGVGYVLLPIGDLRMFARFNTVLYISGCVIDRKSFIDLENPERLLDEDHVSRSMFTVKVEGNNQRSIDKDKHAPDGFRTPFLVGLACRKLWYSTQE